MGQRATAARPYSRGLCREAAHVGHVRGLAVYLLSGDSYGMKTSRKSVKRES